MDVAATPMSKTRKATSSTSPGQPSSYESASPNWAEAFVWKPRSTTWDGLLMCETSLDTWDPTLAERQKIARKRIKSLVFDDLDIDWKSIPAVEETPMKHSTLLENVDLRCKGSREYFGSIVKQHNKASSSNDKAAVVDAAPMVDMIA